MPLFPTLLKLVDTNTKMVVVVVVVADTEVVSKVAKVTVDNREATDRVVPHNKITALLGHNTTHRFVHYYLTYSQGLFPRNVLF